MLCTYLCNMHLFVGLLPDAAAQSYWSVKPSRSKTVPTPPPALPQVTLVGKVLSTNESGLTYGLEIDDGTGKAAVKIWISDDGGCRLLLRVAVLICTCHGFDAKHQALFAK